MEVLSLSTYYELINMTSYINYILFYKIVFYITKHVTEPQMELMMVMWFVMTGQICSLIRSTILRL